MKLTPLINQRTTTRCAQDTFTPFIKDVLIPFFLPDTDLIPERCAFADTHSQANPSVLNRIMCYLLYSCILFLYGC